MINTNNSWIAEKGRRKLAKRGWALCLIIYNGNACWIISLSCFSWSHRAKTNFFVSFYQSVENGFASFHLYVCAAFLKNFSQEIIQENDFQVCLFALLFVFHLFAFCTCHVARPLVLDCILGWFSNRTGTLVDDGARKSNNWLDQ